MTPDDDLDLGELARALDRAAPRPDPARRAADLRLAQEVFDRMHGTARAAVAAPPPAAAPRGRWAALWGGWGTGGALTATTAVVAGAFLVATPLGRGLLEDSLARDEVPDASPPAEGTTATVATEVAEAPQPAAEPAPAPVVAPEPAVAAGSAPAEAEAAPEAVAEAPLAETAGAGPAGIAEAPPVGAATELAETAPEPAPPDAAAEAEAPADEVRPMPPVPAPAPEAVARAEPLADEAPAAAAPAAAEPPADGEAAAARVAEAAPAAPATDADAAIESEAAPDAEAPSPDGAAAVAMAPAPEASRPVPSQPVERTLDDLAQGLVAAAPAGGAPGPGRAAAAAALAAERAPLRSIAEAPMAEVEFGPATGFWAELGASLRAGRPVPPASVRVGEILGAVPAPRGVEADGLGVTVLPAPWDPRHRIVLVSLPDGAPSGAEELRLRAEWDGVASWRLLGAGTPAGEGTPQLLAAFEVTPIALGGGEGLGTLRLGWKGGDGGRGLRQAPIPGESAIAPEARFAAALAGWGLLLRGEELGAWGPGEALALAEANRGKDGAPARDEALDLLRLWAAR